MSWTRTCRFVFADARHRGHKHTPATVPMKRLPGTLFLARSNPPVPELGSVAALVAANSNKRGTDPIMDLRLGWMNFQPGYILIQVKY